MTSKANEMQPDSYTSFLFKGSWGFGKTIAASSFAVLGPIHISYIDKKKPIELLHFYRHIIKRPEILDNISFDVYSSNNINDYLNHVYDLKDSCRYMAVITDSLTSLTAAAVNWSLGFRNQGKPKQDKQAKDAIQTIPDFDEYKVETSLVSQSLGILKTLPCHMIWTAHPLPSIKVEGSGNSIKVTKTNPIVTYGSKVAGIVPGEFNEIYHFYRKAEYDTVRGRQLIRYVVSTEGIGDEMAKSALGLSGEFDITNKLFYEVWKEQVNKLHGGVNDVKPTSSPNPDNPSNPNPKPQYPF